ncbi:MAG: hypothetical protein LBC61_03455 [Candidatus Peribacteria bacterium]|jgi:hypothetical protein|nr:hypothetical protein [Candidatus Peribacteria bacterium]
MSIAHGIVSNVAITSLATLSKTEKSSQAIFNSKAHPAGGQADSSTIVTFAVFIFLNSSLSLVTKLVDNSFLHSSFVYKLTAKEA